MEDRGVCKIDNTCTGKKDCKVYRKQSKRYKTEETAEDVCDLYGQCQHFNPIKWINGPEDALEELLRMPAVMVEHPGARKLGALRFGIEATKKMIPKAVKIRPDNLGDCWTVCPTCGATTIYNTFRRGEAKLYPHCPWCGQKLKEMKEEAANRKSS